MKYKLISDFEELKEGNGILLNGLPYKIIKSELPRLQVKSITDVVIDGDVVDNELEEFETGIKYQINDLTEYLKSRDINFLYYNNLYYYYPTLRESLKQPDKFIIRFLLSKITRRFLERKHEFININRSRISYTISNNIGELLSLLPLVTNIRFDYKIENNNLNLNLYSTVKHITNKEFKINFILNI